MGKKLASWSGMRKYLEQEMIAEGLRGRLRYNCTSYVGMENCRIFEVFVDGRLFKQFSWETVNSYFIKSGIVAKAQPMSIREYWDGFWALLEQYPLQTRTEYTDQEFCAALGKYRNSKIGECIHSDNPIVRMFALFDKRTGKRMLKDIGNEMLSKPVWLQELYRIRTGCDTAGTHG